MLDGRPAFEQLPPKAREAALAYRPRPAGELVLRVYANYRSAASTSSSSNYSVRLEPVAEQWGERGGGPARL